MNFSTNAYVTCTECKNERFNSDTLTILKKITTLKKIGVGYV